MDGSGAERDLQERGADIEIIWDGQIWSMDAWGIPKGTENLEEALGFVRFATEPERLAAQASMVAYGPARRSSHGLIPDAVKPHLPTAEARRDDAFRIDYRWWARHGSAIEQSFDDWLAPKLTVRRKEGH